MEPELWQFGLRVFGRSNGEREQAYAEYSAAILRRFPTAHDWNHNKDTIFSEYIKGECDALSEENRFKYNLYEQNKNKRNVGEDVVAAREWADKFQRAARERLRRLQHRLYPLMRIDLTAAVVVDAERPAVPLMVVEEVIQTPAPPEEIPEPDKPQDAQFEGGQYVPWVEEVAVAAPPSAPVVNVASMERDNRHLVRQGRQFEMQMEMDELTGRMQSARLHDDDAAAVPVRRGRGRPRSSFGLPLETRLQKVNDVIDKYFPGYVASYTEDMGLRVSTI
jgi:hypothetical protein